MADLVTRLRNNVFTSCPCLVCEGTLEAADEIERMAHDIDEYQKNLDAEVAARLSKDREIDYLKRNMQAVWNYVRHISPQIRTDDLDWADELLADLHFMRRKIKTLYDENQRLKEALDKF